MEIKTLEILVYIFLGVVTLLILWVIRLEKRINRLTTGKNGKSLETSIHNLKEKTEKVISGESEINRRIEILENKISESIRRVETVRFNPFKGTGGGGNQSFATVFLNESGDGVVFSTLYSRERVSIYSKPLENFKSKYELSDEEKEVLDKAKTDL